MSMRLEFELTTMSLSSMLANMLEGFSLCSHFLWNYTSTQKLSITQFIIKYFYKKENK